MFAPHAIFFANYAVPDKETMFLPTYLSWTFWLAIGIADLRQMAARVLARRQQAVLAVALLLLPLAALLVNFSRVDVSGDRRARVWAESVLHVVEPDALVLGWWTRSTLLRYFQETDGQRPDVRVIDRGQLSAEAMRRLIDDSLPRRPVYLLGHDPVWEQTYQLVAAGEAYRVLPKEAGP